MKTNHLLHKILAATAALILSFDSARAADVLISKFDSPADANAWYWENWSVAGSLTHDAALDAGGGNPDGSLRLVNNFANSPGTYQQCVFTFALPAAADAETLYSHISLDVKVDPSSTPRAAGDYGSLEIVIRNGNDWTWNSRVTVPLNGTGWTHVTAPVGAPANAIHHVTIKLGQNALLGPVTYNLDNITWTEASTPPPPPTMSIRPAKPGLNFIGSAAGPYDRQNIFTPTAIASWIGGFDDVTFAMTINDAPGNANNFQTHMFIVQGAPGTDTAPDWTLPNVIFIQIANNANGTASAYFRAKVNEPSNNTQFWAGTAPSVTGPSLRGTWSVSFLPNGDVTLTAPGGAKNTFQMSPATSAGFSGNLTAYFGIMPNGPENIGKGISLSNVRISSAGSTVLEDDFPGPNLDPAKFVVSAADPNGVKLLTPATAGFWLKWTAPDAGYTLQSTSTLSPPDWQITAAAPFGATSRHAHMPKNIPSEEQGYFQLFKQQ